MGWLIRNKISFVALIVITGVFIVEFFYDLDDKIFLGLLGVVATIYFGLIRYSIEDDKLFKELFEEFNSKYNIKMNDLFTKLRLDPNHELVLSEKQLIIDYFNLCAEEYLWRSRNRIPKEVWFSWKEGIMSNLEITQVKELYESEVKETNSANSYYGLVGELEEK